MKRIKYLVIALMTTISVTACGVYSSVQKTVDPELTDDIYNYIEATSDTTNLASLSWRELFTDSKLQALIEEALANNADLNVARLNAEQAELSLSVARKAFLPTLNLVPQGSVTSFKGSTSKTYNVSLTSSWEIDVFGKLRNAKKQTEEAFTQSVAYRQAVQTQLIATLASSYYSLQMLDEQLAISEQTQVNWAENIRVMEAMKQAGRIDETSVLQSKASSIALNSQIVTIKEQIAELENSISLLLASPTKHIERESITSFECPSILNVGVALQLLSNRPDVRAAESYLAEMFYATAEARSSLYPSFTLSGSAGYTNSSGSITNPGDMLYSLVASALQPIFNAGALRAQLKISEAKQEQALLEFKQAILDAGAEVNNALSAYQSAQERLINSQEQIQLLEQTVTKTKLLMTHGSATSLEVLTAQLSLLQAELSLASDKYNETQGVISLYRALGGGER